MLPTVQQLYYESQTLGWGAIASWRTSLLKVGGHLEAITTRLEAIATRLEAIATY